MMTTSAMAQDATDEADDPTMSTIAVVVDDGFVQYWHDLSPDADGIAIGEPDPNEGMDPVDDGGEDPAVDPADDGSDGGVDDGSDDGWVDDGTDGWVDDGTDGGSDEGTGGGSEAGGSDGEVTIYYMDGGPELCAECDVGTADLPVEAYQMGAEGPMVAPGTAPLAHKSNRLTTHGFAVSAMHECLVLHPQSPWICEWQNGAGQ